MRLYAFICLVQLVGGKTKPGPCTNNAPTARCAQKHRFQENGAEYEPFGGKPTTLCRSRWFSALSLKSSLFVTLPCRASENVMFYVMFYWLFSTNMKMNRCRLWIYRWNPENLKPAQASTSQPTVIPTGPQTPPQTPKTIRKVGIDRKSASKPRLKLSTSVSGAGRREEAKQKRPE